MKNLFRNIILTFFSFGMFFSCGTGVVNIAHAAEQDTPSVAKEETPVSNYTIDGRYYQIDDNTQYYHTYLNEITDGLSAVYRGGHRSVGSFFISGKINHHETEVRRDPNNNDANNFLKAGLEENISFNYDYDTYYNVNNIRDRWYLNSDSESNYCGLDVGSSFSRGLLLIEKSYDGIHYDLELKLTDFLGQDRPGFYTTSGEDIGRGCYYRVSIAYEMSHFYKVWWWDEYSQINYIEQYDFYVAKNTGIIALHNFGVEIPNPEDGTLTPEDNPESVPDQSEKDTVQDQDAIAKQNEILARGETLVDGSITNTGFVVDKFNNLSCKVMVSKDGAPEVEAENNQHFKEDGTYRIRAVSVFGVEKITNITVFTGGETEGFSTYFNDYLVVGKRMFDHGPLPTYARGSKIAIKPVEDWMPAMQGNILNYTTGEIIEIKPTRTGYELELSPDNYMVVLYAGDPTQVGTVIKYEFRFKISELDAGPRVNYEILNNTHNLYDLQSKHYEVAIPTTKGPYIYICFALDSKDEALEYARQSEERYIEEVETDDGKKLTYYKSMDNPQTKIPYTSKIKLTEALYYYGAKNVEIAYFDPTDEFTYQTYQGDLLKDLLKLQPEKSIRLFPNEEEKEKICKRQRFLNDYQFLNVAGFDVTKVTAKCVKDNRVYNINLEEPVSNQLNVTSKYIITETNVYGDTLEYECYYIKENTAVTSWEVIVNDESSTIDIDNSMMTNGKYVINCDTLAIKDVTNELDEDTIITIYAPNVYYYKLKCYTDEFLNVDLYKEGIYTINIIDRLGNYYTIEAHISGRTRHNKVVSRNRLNYTKFYNTIYDNDLKEDQELFLDDSTLMDSIAREVDYNIYLPSTVKNYKNRLQEAIDTYKNPNATQHDLDKAAYDLNQAYRKLLPAIDRSELDIEIKKFEDADSSLYVTNTYEEWAKAYDKGILAYGDDELNEAQLYEIVLEMRNANKKLVLRGIKTDLITLLNKINSIDTEKYTPKTIESLNDSYLAGIEIYNNIDALQDEIDDIIKLIVLKKDNLELRADFYKLEELIDKVISINKKNYTKESIANLKVKFDDALVVFNDKNQGQDAIDDVYFALYDAFSEIVPIGDKEDLISLMYEISSIEQCIYTKESIDNLKKVYDECFNLLDHEISQSEVDVLFEKLKTSKKNLVESQNKKLLKEALISNEVKDLEKYSIGNANAYVDAYNEVSKALYSNDDVDDLTTNTLINNLVQAKNDLPNVKIDWVKLGIYGGSGAGGLAIIITTICLIVKHRRKIKIGGK